MKILSRMEVICISGIPVNENQKQCYKRIVGDTEITVENIYPKFKSEEDRASAKKQIMQTLYDIFSKYEENR